MKTPRLLFRLLTFAILAGLLLLAAAPILAQEGDPGSPGKAPSQGQPAVELPPPSTQDTPSSIQEVTLTPKPTHPIESPANPINTEAPTRIIPSALPNLEATPSPAEILPSPILTDTSLKPNPADRLAALAVCPSSISFGQTIQCSITSIGEEDAYTFTAVAGDIVLAQVSTASGNLWPGIKILSGTAELCKGNGQTSAEIVSCSLPSPGDYILLVNDSFNGTYTGDYYLFLQRLNNPGNVTPINYGQILERTIHVPAEMDTYTFAAASGDAGLVKMSNTSDSLWPGVRVYRPDGTMQCEASAPSTAEITDCPLPGAGTYTILAFDSFNGTYTGNYSLTVNSGRPPRSPAKSAILEYNRPTFIWDAVAGTANYTLQVSSVSTFTSTVVNTITTAPTYTMTTSLSPANKLMYWRTRAGSGAWSEVWTFTTANPPSVPGLSLPANAGLVTTYTPLLDWSNSTVPVGTAFDHYLLQIATDTGFTNSLPDIEVPFPASNSKWTLLSPLEPNQTFYWKVRAHNTARQYGLWSAVRSFRTPMLPPVLISPASPTIPDTLRPIFTWNEVETATGYAIQVSTSAVFTSTVVNTTMGGLAYAPTANLPANKTLYWRMHADGANPSVWSSPLSFLSPNPPSTPSLALPANSGLVTNYTPRLDWSTSTVPAGTDFDHYRLQIAIDAGFTTSLQNIEVPGENTDSEKILSAPLAPNIRYFWRVAAYNKDGQFSAWSSIRSFRTPMEAPVLIEPVNPGKPAMTTRPIFTWNAVSTATGYAIQVSTVPGFTSTVVNTTVKVPTYTPGSDLPRNKTLYWRVHADGANPSNWAAYFTFTSANPPSVPALASPADGVSISTYTPRLDWSDSTLPNSTTFGYYLLQIAANAGFTSRLPDIEVPGPNTNSEKTLTNPLTPNRTYYWRLRAYNTAGQYSNWSAVRHFHTTLPAPTLATPEKEDTSVSRQPTFTWNAQEEATGYVIQVSTNSNFGSTIINKTVPSNIYAHTSSLTSLKRYYWRVQAKGTYSSPWSEVWYFDTQ